MLFGEQLPELVVAQKENRPKHQGGFLIGDSYFRI